MTVADDFSAMRAVDRLHYLISLTENPAYIAGVFLIKSTHAYMAVHGATPEARETDRQMVLAIESLESFLADQIAMARADAQPS